jgi:hypothetical protein
MMSTPSSRSPQTRNVLTWAGEPCRSVAYRPELLPELLPGPRGASSPADVLVCGHKRGPRIRSTALPPIGHPRKRPWLQAGARTRTSACRGNGFTARLGSATDVPADLRLPHCLSHQIGLPSVPRPCMPNRPGQRADVSNTRPSESSRVLSSLLMPRPAPASKRANWLDDWEHRMVMDDRLLG